MKNTSININDIKNHPFNSLNARTWITRNRCPYKYKYELKDWAVRYKGWSKSQANRLSKKQLYAIWYKGG